MMSLDALEQLDTALDLERSAERTQAMARFLAQLVHDLNNPLGTFGLELYSLQSVPQRIKQAAAAADRALLDEQLRRLADICGNLQSAQDLAAERLAAIQRVGQRWSQRFEPGD